MKISSVPAAIRVWFSNSPTAGAGRRPFLRPEFQLPPALTLQLLLEHCASWIEAGPAIGMTDFFRAGVDVR